MSTIFSCKDQLEIVIALSLHWETHLHEEKLLHSQ
jgi:hypothetical protein